MVRIGFRDVRVGERAVRNHHGHPANDGLDPSRISKTVKRRANLNLFGKFNKPTGSLASKGSTQ